MHAWEGFFTAQVASTAALAGLLFVALSVNVARILQYPWLPERAAQTLVVLMGALAISSFMLFPAASARIVNYLAVGTALLRTP
jgi:modulator of FtsH protease